NVHEILWNTAKLTMASQSSSSKFGGVSRMNVCVPPRAIKILPIEIMNRLSSCDTPKIRKIRHHIGRFWPLMCNGTKYIGTNQFLLLQRFGIAFQ
ncbi:8607_t:CDS:1, partial [Funneliformis caledonium]